MCFPEWIYSAIWQVSESPRQICNGKRAVQERMCVISRFIDQKMKSEEFPECPFHLMALHGESVEFFFSFSVFLFWLLVVPAYFF